MGVRFGVSVCAVGAALGLSACGGGDGGSDDPASLTPATAPVYVQGAIRPQGDLKANVEDLATTISGEQDPGGRLVEYLDQQLSEGDVSYSDDIKPWLGERGAIFIEGFAGEDEDGGLILQTTDSGGAQDFIDKVAATSPDSEDRSYEGVDYKYDPNDDQAVAIVDDFLVFGDNEVALKDAIDASNGDSLADESTFTDTIDGAPSGSLADVYVDLDSFAKEVARRVEPDTREFFEGALGDTSGKTALASLVPSADSLEVDLRTNVGQGFQPADLSELIGSFPSDSFAAVGLPNVGDAIKRTIDQIEGSGIGGITPGAIDQQLAPAGLSLDEITGAIGDVGLFVEGTDQQSLEGAVVITTDDEQAAKDLVGKLTDLALKSGEPGIERVSGGTGFSIRDPDLGPKPAILLTEGDRIAFGYGEAATGKALSTAGRDTLDSDPVYQQATEALGGVDLSGYVALAPILKLAEAFGATADPDYEVAKPYLEKIPYLVFGSGKEGDFSTTKLVVGVQK